MNPRALPAKLQMNETRPALSAVEGFIEWKSR